MSTLMGARKFLALRMSCLVRRVCSTPVSRREEHQQSNFKKYITTLKNSIPSEILDDAVKNVDNIMLKMLTLGQSSQILQQKFSFSTVPGILEIIEGTSIPIYAVLSLPTETGCKLFKRLKKTLLKTVANVDFDSTNNMLKAVIPTSYEYEVADVALVLRTIKLLIDGQFRIFNECVVTAKDTLPGGKLDMVVAGEMKTAIFTDMSDDFEDESCDQMAITVKNPDQELLLRSERQAVIETLAFAEAARSEGTSMLIKISRFTFRLYVYIRPLDILLRSGTLPFSTQSNFPLEDCLTGLALLGVILNGDHCCYYEHYKLLLQQHSQQSGWRNGINGRGYQRLLLKSKPMVKHTTTLNSRVQLQKEYLRAGGDLEMIRAFSQMRHQLLSADKSQS